MKKILIGIGLFFLMAIPVSAMEFTAPEAPNEAQRFIDEETESFGEGLWYIIRTTVSTLRPEIQQAASSSLALITVAILTSLAESTITLSASVNKLVATLAISYLLIKPTNSCISLGIKTVQQLSEYGKVFLPVMTSALAAQGGTSGAAATYAATAIFDTLLCSGISKLMVPMLYIYLCLSIAQCAAPHDAMKEIRNAIKWIMSWLLKLSLYAFTGYLTITGVVSGSVDASAVKAAKIALSGSVPIVGSIISDASEAILVSAGIMKNAAGVYGIFTFVALFLSPFLSIGVQHICLKATAALCGVFGSKRSMELVQDFSTIMGFLLAMTGTICLLHLISTVCFMRGVA